MPSNPQGLAIALERIRAEKEAKTGFLDLGRLGLEELPEELFELRHLRGLNLGHGWMEDTGFWHPATADDAANELSSQLSGLGHLPELQLLSIASTTCSSLAPLSGLSALQTLSCSSTQVTDLSPLSGLSALQTLSCSSTQVTDLSPLSGLSALQSLDCSYTQVTDLSPLSGLSALRTLDCSITQVTDLSPLSGLSALQTLSCSSTQVTDLSPLSGLSALQTLSCSSTQVTDLSPLSGLSALRTLDCSITQVTDLSPLSGLSALQTLSCSSTQVTDLSPLSGLSALQTLSCSSTQVTDLSPLSGLSALQTLSCSSTQVTDLSPLSGLSALRTLYCSITQVTDLSPLSGLSALQTLSCSSTQVTDLSPLSGLSALRTLDCSITQVTDLSPLSGLSALQTLDCSSTQVTDLSPLEQVSTLRRLSCSSTRISKLPEGLLWHAGLSQLFAHATAITTLPVEVLSQGPWTDCLASVQAHVRDLDSGVEPLRDHKVIVLGNGRIGKTQICRRLRGERFEADADSTHGIVVTSTDLPATDGKPTVRLHLWDFGGQDLYHGTHALFMKTRSVFLLVWTPKSEDSREHEHAGLTFRNRPLAYWVESVRAVSDTDVPLLLVQNQCERAEDEAMRPPVREERLASFGFRKQLHFSAKTNRGRAALDEALGQAIEWMRERHGPSSIGTGRLAVKRKLEEMRDQDARRPVDERRHRTMTQEQFRQLCEETGGISSPRHLLDYLHHAGVVFHREGLFADAIVLDQAWALEAVYVVFNREQCWRQLRTLRGRFTRSLLDSLVWRERGYSSSEQELLLSMMQSCGICFVHRPPGKGSEEAEFIAPDLLPERADVADEIDARWKASEPYEERVFELPFLQPGLMRGVISRIGAAAGIHAIYWRQGVCLYERRTRSHALIEERRNEEKQAWSGSIVLRTQGGQARELLAELTNWVVSSGHGTVRDADGQRRPAIDRDDAARGLPEDATPPRHGIADRSPTLEFASAPTTRKTYCVSYAWTDASNQIVDQLCDAAVRRGVRILRDRDGLKHGESISRFMQQIGAGDRVFVILSDRYLKSESCMYELMEVWRNSRSNLEEFRKRIQVFRLPDAKMLTVVDRLRCAKHWKDQFEALQSLVKEVGADLLGAADFARYRLMKDFVHNVGDMLALIADTLLPKDFKELEERGFE